jgi:hypothetical protein
MKNLNTTFLAPAAMFVVFFLGAQLSTLRGAAQAESTVALVGPIPLGELFRNRSNKEVAAKRMASEEWPTEEDIIVALNKTKVWIKDTKTLEAGKWKLVFQDNPSILLEGPVSFDLKGKNGGTFTISIKDIEQSDTGFGVDGKSRRMRVFIRFRTSPYRTPISSSASGLNIFSDYIIWDLSGKVTWIGKKP